MTHTHESRRVDHLVACVSSEPACIPSDLPCIEASAQFVFDFVMESTEWVDAGCLVRLDCQFTPQELISAADMWTELGVFEPSPDRTAMRMLRR